MRGFHDLFFARDPIPESLREQLVSCDAVSEDGETCRRYLLLLAQTCQVVVMTWWW